METARGSNRTAVVSVSIAALLSLVAVVFLSRLAAEAWEGKLWELGFIPVFLFGLFGILGVLTMLDKRHFLQSFPRKRFACAIGLAYVLLLAGVRYVAGSSLLRTTVHVDNFSEHDLILQLNGDLWLKIKKGESQRVRMARRNFQVVLKDEVTNYELEQLNVTVDSNGPFVLNCLGAQRYIRGMKVYSNFGISSPSTTETADRWIRTDVDFLFEQPPQRVPAAKDEMAVSRTFLLRN